ncbi:cell wall hydrolase [Brevundimonas variabilis]|uniref:Spore germination cell wall hydrolase CwlJ-like protein n=1 Tax=Brevundimonas variabilis TaxID=74312 RepID=A0A7W9FF55_9CAUL|nr:cell wall hydrolase [Brevundimonas variabilis]MBB5745064.1 spore germination cell wall hydrolase CwlJ-like protein [Brevundimonas variabilis]
MSERLSTDAAARADRKAPLRPLTATLVLGAMVGVAVGCGWLGNTVAQATTIRAQAERIAAASSAGFTDEALNAAAGGLDASALAIARRHDPYTVAGSAQRDRQAELLTARLETLRGSTRPTGLRQINLTSTPDPARPFRLGGALDQSRDLECLTQAAYYEARGEGRDGMRAVAQVVLNRVRHSAFPKTVCGVVYQGANRRVGCQFSFTCNGSMRGTVNRTAWNRARAVASSALSGDVYPAVGNATFFHTTGVAPGWRNSMIRVGQVGDHLFYRFGGRTGSRDAFRYQPSPSATVEPRLIQAGIDPTTPVRQAGQAIAYSVLLAQEDRTAPRGESVTPAEKGADSQPIPVAKPEPVTPSAPSEPETASVASPSV